MRNVSVQFLLRKTRVLSRLVAARKSRIARAGSVWMLAPMLSLLAFVGGDNQPVKNGGFESATPTEAWHVEGDEAKQEFSLSLDNTDAKEGSQSLLVAADHPVHLTLHQEVFLPIGTLWRLTGWVKSSASPVPTSNDPYADKFTPGPRIGIEAQVGDQGYSPALPSSGEWQQQTVLFRVPSPGRIGVALNALNNQSGKVWFDDIRLERVP